MEQSCRCERLSRWWRSTALALRTCPGVDFCQRPWRKWPSRILTICGKLRLRSLNVQEILDAAQIASEKKYDFKGVICFVDAVNFLEQVKDEETAFRQLKHCNLAVITKTDLADAGLMEQVAERSGEILRCEILEVSMRKWIIPFTEEI